MGFKCKKSEHPKLYLCNTPIVNVSKHKHIGLWLEDNLGWHVHVRDICIKAQCRLNYLKQSNLELVEIHWKRYISHLSGQYLNMEMLYGLGLVIWIYIK